MLVTTGLKPEPTGALTRAKTGDEAAFADLVREHQSMVFSICFNSTRNRAVAEEMAQEVFLHLFRNLGQIESPAHLSHWLRRVAGHRVIDQSRRAKYRPKIGLDDAPEPSVRPSETDPLFRNRLDRLIDELPGRSKAILTLRYQEDLEPAEIAGVLEIPVGTVKSNLHRSLALLRGKLNKLSGRLTLTEGGRA